MTEEEAKTKWCPLTRSEGDYAYGLPTHNRGRDGEFSNRHCCIGSACMAWRWQRIPEMYRYRDIHGNQQLGTKEGAQSTTDGYCGLAGKP